MIERRREVEEKGIVLDGVEVDVLLERGDQHPEKGKRQRDGEDDQHENVQSLDAGFAERAASHHTTSARCATRSIRYATATSTGTRKSEIAAPAARSLPAIPVAKASDGRVCVESKGPPAVRM